MNPKRKRNEKKRKENSKPITDGGVGPGPSRWPIRGHRGSDQSAAAAERKKEKKKEKPRSSFVFFSFYSFFFASFSFLFFEIFTFFFSFPLQFHNAEEAGGNFFFFLFSIKKKGNQSCRMTVLPSFT